MSILQNLQKTFSTLFTQISYPKQQILSNKAAQSYTLYLLYSHIVISKSHILYSHIPFKQNFITNTFFPSSVIEWNNLQSWTKYLRQTLVFMWRRALPKKVQFLFFNKFFASIDKSFVLEGRLSTRLWKFEIFLIFLNFLRF